jgi:hypothetical protein
LGLALETVQKNLDQGALPNPRFARDEHQLPLALQHVGKQTVQLCQFRFPPDDSRSRGLSVGGRGEKVDRGRLIVLCSPLRCIPMTDDLPDESVAHPMHGGNVARLRGVFS